MAKCAIRLAATVLLTAATAGCVSPAAPPAPAPAPVPASPPPLRVAPPAPTPAAADWMEAPLSPGDWHYRQDGATALAIYVSGSLALTLRCDRSRSISLWFTGAQAASITVRTSYGERRLAAERVRLNEMSAALPADDPLLDQIAFSRGRILVQPEGGPALIVPSWPEIPHLVEECRGA